MSLIQEAELLRLLRVAYNHGQADAIAYADE